MEGSMVYQWSEGTRVRIPAQVAGEELERLAAEGEVTPARVVDVSRPKDAPLHSHFEWDNAAAAEAYRRDQARYLLRHIKVVVKCDEGELPTVVRAFVNVALEPAEGEEVTLGTVYMTTRAAMANEYTRRQVLADALARIRQWRVIYGEYEEFAEIVAAIDAVELKDAIEQAELALVAA